MVTNRSFGPVYSLLSQSRNSYWIFCSLTLLHSEQPKLYGVLAVLSAIGSNAGWLWNMGLPAKLQISFQFLTLGDHFWSSFSDKRRQDILSGYLKCLFRFLELLLQVSLLGNTTESSSSSSDFLLTCRYRANIHNNGPPSRQLACCTHGRSHTRSPGVSIMRVIAESFLSLQSLSVSCFQVILGLSGPHFPSTCISKAVLTAPLERSPYQGSLLSFSMRSRSSMPSRSLQTLLTTELYKTQNFRTLISLLKLPCDFNSEQHWWHNLPGLKLQETWLWHYNNWDIKFLMWLFVHH